MRKKKRDSERETIGRNAEEETLIREGERVGNEGERDEQVREEDSNSQC